jgi:hypothetical protein
VIERDIQAQILLALSRGPTRLLRINAGVAWQGSVLQHNRDLLVLADPRALRLAAPGVSDLIGWTEGGRFVAVEVKGPRGRVTDEQKAFIDLVRRSGGLAGVARSVEEATAILEGHEL